MRNMWPIFKRLGLHADDDDDAFTGTFDIVFIPFAIGPHYKQLRYERSPRCSARSDRLTLIGCFVRNKWILAPETIDADDGDYVICHGDDDSHYIDNDSDAKPRVTFFDIY
ncbi:hypothetical protein BCR42DRAFT_429529 [Absidia repens]|uniref:Uncharacterized protein n=1 Tax=Absidia repens TaxID=90262 RepID=A0A1X2HWY7_9FUNG|nr:hypothetical protein BCR42DRAFT_429529 [Absidia repens]